MDTLGERIKHTRKRNRWSQAKLAKLLGLKSPVAISKYEKNQREPDVAKLIKIGRIGHVSLDWLLTGEGYIERKEVISELARSHEDPRLASLTEKLDYIYKEGTLKDRAEVRGIIEEVYDSVIEPEKKTVVEEAVQAAAEEPPNKKRRAAG